MKLSDHVVARPEVNFEERSQNACFFLRTKAISVVSAIKPVVYTDSCCQALNSVDKSFAVKFPNVHRDWMRCSAYTFPTCSPRIAPVDDSIRAGTRSVKQANGQLESCSACLWHLLALRTLEFEFSYWGIIYIPADGPPTIYQGNVSFT
jgi:hypothetical protein